MKTVISLLLCAAMGYLIGSINPSYLIARRKGFDIREAGSGNAGGSNALITMGKAVGAFCCVFDILKAYFVIKFALHLFAGLKLVYPVTAASCIIGHMFPVFMKFHGGKGLACLGGSILAYSPRVFFIMLTIELVLAFLINYICVVPITVSVIYPILYGILESSFAGFVIFLPVTFSMVYKHMENLNRIRKGLELHFSYLWKKDEERERLTENISQIDETQVDRVWHN